MTDATTPAAARAVSSPLAMGRRDIEDWIDSGTLPDCAREFLLEIKVELSATSAAVIAAQDDMTAASETRAAARRERAKHREAAAGNGRKLPAELAEQLDASNMRADARFERARADYRSAVDRSKEILALKAAALEFLNTNPGLVAAPVPKSPAKPLESLRERLGAIDAERDTTEAAPLTRQEVIEDLKSEVGEIAAKGAPTVSTRDGEGRPVRLREALMIASGPNSMLLGDAGAALWCWLFHDELIAALVEMVPADQPGALSRAARAERLAALAAERLEVEHAEERLIRQARADGRVIQRRPDASPEAVLLVQIRGRL